MITIQTNTQEVTRDLNKFIFVTLTKATDDAIKQTVDNIQAKMGEEPGPVQRPIRWDSPKQQRAYFATDGFGAGIPYRRTGKRRSGFEERQIPHGWELSNKTPGAIYLFGKADGSDISAGKKQSNIHAGTWRLFRPTVDAEVAKLPDELVERIHIEA
jgi:hypothetical protein